MTDLWDPQASMVFEQALKRTQRPETGGIHLDRFSSAEVAAGLFVSNLHDAIELLKVSINTLQKRRRQADACYKCSERPFAVRALKISVILRRDPCGHWTLRLPERTFPAEAAARL